MVWIYWEDDIPIAETTDSVSEPEPETLELTPSEPEQGSEPETSDPAPAPSVPELESEPETSESAPEEDGSSSSTYGFDSGLDGGSTSSEPETPPPDEETSTPTTGAEPRPFLSTPVEEYTVTEGLLLCVLVVLLSLGLLSIVRRH